MEKYNIGIPIMMESAGLHYARLAYKYFIDGNYNQIVIIVGSGNNGGGGLVAARRLLGWGLQPLLILPKGKPKGEILKLQFGRIKNLGIKHTTAEEIDSATLVMDAIIGYNFKPPLTETMIQTINCMRKADVISLDLPTGIDANSGSTQTGLNPIATLALAWPKSGLYNTQGKFLGRTFLADIGIPFELILSLGLEITGDDLKSLYQLFTQSSLLEISFDKIGNWQPQ